MEVRKASMEIIVKDDSYFSYADNYLFGTIYISIDKFMFPCVDWTDFIEEVLTMWANEMMKHNDQHYSHFPLYFMDGDYWLDVYKDDGMQLEIKCMNDNITIYEFKCSYFDFLLTIYNGMASFVSLLHQKQKSIKTCNFSGTLKCIKSFMDRIEKIRRREEDKGTVSVNPK